MVGKNICVYVGTHVPMYDALSAITDHTFYLNIGFSCYWFV